MSNASHCEQAAGRPWLVLILLTAICFLCHFNRISISVAGTERLIDQYQISEVQMGWVYFAYLLVYTLCMIPGGWLIDRYGPWRMLLLMELASAVFVALTGAVWLLATASTAVFWFFLVRVPLGIASVPMHPGAARAVGLWMPAGLAGAANGLVTAGALLGIACSYPVFGYLMDRFDWPIAFALCGGATLLLAIAWAALAEPKPGAPRPAVTVEQHYCVHWAALFADRNLILLTLSYAAVGYFQYLFFYWAEYYFHEVLGASLEASRAYAAAPSLAMAASMFLGGGLSDWLLRRFGRRAGRVYLPVLGMIASADLLWLGTQTSEPLHAAVWFALAMAALGISEGPFWVAAIAVGGRRGGSSAAFFNAGGNAGGMLAPLATPWIKANLGWQSSFDLASAACLVGALLWMGVSVEPNEA